MYIFKYIYVYIVYIYIYIYAFSCFLCKHGADYYK